MIKKKHTGTVIGPSEDRREDRPALVACGGIWGTTVEVPDVALYPIRTGASSSRIIDISSQKVVECVLFEASYGLAEEPRSNEQKEVRYNGKENRQSWRRMS